MVPLNLVQRVAERIKKIAVGVENLAIERELDNCLRFADGGNLTLVVGILQLLLRCVRRDLADLKRLAVQIENWIVPRLNPTFPAALADALVLSGVRFAAAELLPKQPIFGALPVCGI